MEEKKVITYENTEYDIKEAETTALSKLVDIFIKGKFIGTVSLPLKGKHRITRAQETENAYIIEVGEKYKHIFYKSKNKKSLIEDTTEMLLKYPEIKDDYESGLITLYEAITTVLFYDDER